MDKLSSVLGAFDAQKLPSQAQTNAWIDWLVHQIDEFTAETTDKSQLSAHGKKLASDVKGLLLAYKQLGQHKNGDDQLQNAIWNLTQGEMNVTSEKPSAMKHEAIDDAQRFSSALHNMLLIFWGHFTTFDDESELVSLIRNILADAAEVVEQKSGAAKAELREAEEQGYTGTAQDPTRKKFEAVMDTAKVTGSQAIGAGKAVKEGAEEMGDKSTRRVGDVLDNVLKRAQDDKAYRDSITTVFDLSSKWLDKAVKASDKTCLDDVVDDPSGRISASWSSLNTIVERLAGGKSTGELTQAFRTAAEDVRDDPELHKLFDDMRDFIRHTLHEPTFARSEQYSEQRAQLGERWQRLRSGETHMKWHGDLDKLCSEARNFVQCIEQDSDVRRLRDAYNTLSKDGADAAGTLSEVATGAANWIWHDAVNVLLPKVLEGIENLPIPRTEYKDADVEFVIEDLNITSLRILPGRAHIRSLTDVDISKESLGKEATTQIKSQTQICLKGVQFTAKDISFWYNDRSMKPLSEVSGLMGIKVPEQGVDVDILLGYLPKRDSKPGEPAFFDVDRIKVTLNNPYFSLTKTNHPILFSAFKPVFRSRLEHTIEASLEEQIVTAIHVLDNLSCDIQSRAGVFRDTGMAPSASYISAVWSEIGHLKSLPGPFSGLQATGVGIVRDDPRSDAKFAIGVQPQIIPGEKHGPTAPGSSAQEQREQAAQVVEQSKHHAEKVKDRETQTVDGVKSFAEQVKVKKERECAVEGWKSAAFDAPQ